MGGYLNRHRSLNNLQDKAKYYFCIDCGLRAKDWSYTGDCLDEVREEAGKYCPHNEHYEPRCRSCHMKYDGKKFPVRSRVRIERVRTRNRPKKTGTVWSSYGMGGERWQ